MLKIADILGGFQGAVYSKMSYVHHPEILDELLGKQGSIKVKICLDYRVLLHDQVDIISTKQTLISKSILINS